MNIAKHRYIVPIIILQFKLNMIQKVNIRYTTPIHLLKVLWYRAGLSTSASLATISSGLSDKEAAHAVYEKGGKVGIVKGKIINVDFSKEEINPYYYDLFAGNGAFKAAVDEVRFFYGIEAENYFMECNE